MKKEFHRAIAIGISLLLTSLWLPADLNDQARQATAPDQKIALQAQDDLRAAGPDGLQALEKYYAAEIAAHRAGQPGLDDQWPRIESALNHVAAQYDEASSGLYWYTDFDQARAAAQASGRPILSLRLLGRLDEDLSCANSRFFRTTLYPDARVRQVLRNRFVLYWESVRPAPLVTIDFGGGRKLVRTITGNSIHYILTPNGDVVDALPGLYGAGTFAQELQTAADLADRYREKDFSLTQGREATRQRLLSDWKRDLAAITSSRSVPDQPDSAQLEFATTESNWELIAARHRQEAMLDPNALTLVMSKFPTAAAAAPVAMSKMIVETPTMRAVRSFQTTTSLDTVRDNYLLRPKILAYLQTPEAQRSSLAQINDWVYARIFLTPKEDPWLGLAPQDVFTGIDRNGQNR